MISSCKRFQRGVSIAVLAAVAVLGGTARAQEAPDAQAADGQEEDEIIVTGSRIRGIEPVGSNVIDIDMQDIQEEPVISTNDLLRRVP